VIAAMSARTLRRAQRRVHLLAATVLFTYVYAPLGAELQDVGRFGVFPVLGLSGIAMWQVARTRRVWRSLRAARHRGLEEPNRKGGYRRATARDG
jgi:hypothetical protein